MKLFNKFLTIIESRVPGMDELFTRKLCSRRNIYIYIYRMSLLSLLFLHLSKDTKRESCINLLLLMSYHIHIF